MTFVKALYEGGRYMRCPYSCRPSLNAALETRWLVLDILDDVINDLLSLHQEEFESDLWETSDNIDFIDLEKDDRYML